METGIRDKVRRRWPNIQGFYAERGGERSGESDFGAWWTDGARWPHYRVSVVHDTGDIYAMNLQTGAVELLSQFLGMSGCPGTTHEDTCAYQIAERLLAGWSDQSYELSWAREHLA